MRRPGHEDWKVQLARQHQQPGNMIGMFVGDEDGRKGTGIVSDCLHAFESLATGDAGIDKDAGRGALHDCAVSPAPTSQYRDTNTHAGSILRMIVEAR